jgi:hypothetical protein
MCAIQAGTHTIRVEAGFPFASLFVYPQPWNSFPYLAEATGLGSNMKPNRACSHGVRSCLG